VVTAGERNVLREIRVGDVTVGRRRKEMDDLTSLAESIRREGLPPPVGVTEDLELVFGERRLQTVRGVLKRKTKVRPGWLFQCPVVFQAVFGRIVFHASLPRVALTGNGIGAIIATLSNGGTWRKPRDRRASLRTFPPRGG
jgi:hypothetical protein